MILILIIVLLKGNLTSFKAIGVNCSNDNFELKNKVKGND